MRMEQFIDYEELNSALRRIDALQDAAECHGILCGMLCEQGSVERDYWVRQVIGDADRADVLVAEAVTLLHRLYDVSLRQLNDTELGFHLLLPGNEDSLEQAVAALSEWCQGFLYGFNINGGKTQDKLPGNVREVMEDLVEISRVDLEVDGEEDESSFAEVIEYVRMAVILILEELHPLRVSTRLQ